MNRDRHQFKQQQLQQLKQAAQNLARLAEGMEKAAQGLRQAAGSMDTGRATPWEATSLVEVYANAVNQQSRASFAQAILHAQEALQALGAEARRESGEVLEKHGLAQLLALAALSGEKKQ